MTGLFWNLATSDIALGILGAVVAASLLVGHVPLIGRLISAVAPYIVAARLVSIATAAWLCFLIGFRVSDERAAVAQLKAEIAWKDNELEQQKATAEDAARLAAQKALEAGELKTKVDDYVEQLSQKPVSSACVYDDNDLRSLRAIGGSGRSQRSNPARLRKSGG